MTDNWIVANLKAALNFFNSMMQYLYDILIINPVTYREGAVWQVVDIIYTSLLGISISLCVIFFYIGIMQDSVELIQHRRWEVIIWDLIKFTMMSGLILYGRYLLLLIFSIGKELVDAVVLKNGSNLLETEAWIELPDAIVNATNGLSTTSGIVIWVVTLIGALVIMVACFTIMLTIYGRLFKIYLHISISPPFIACSAGKLTMHWAINFLKSFFVVCIEGVVIVAVCLIFSAFANGFDINNPMETATVVEEQPEEPPSPEDIVIEWGETVENGDEIKAENAETVWIYLGETLFLFTLLASTIKGTDEILKRWVGA